MERKQLAYIGRQLRFARDKMSLTQAQVAKMLNISQNFYSKWESGNHAFTFLQICNASDTLHISLEILNPNFLTENKNISVNSNSASLDHQIRSKHYETELSKKEEKIRELQSQLRKLVQRELPYGL